MKISLGEPVTSAIKKWEAAGASLSLALSHYLSLSSFLLESSLPGDKNAIDLASRIDTSLQDLHTALDQQFVQARVALSMARNRIVSRMYCFPEEILCEIFAYVVYDRNYKVDPRSGPFMTHRMRTIYQNLHTLLAVCSTWRRAGIARQPFWSIIPIIGPNASYGLLQSRLLATEVSLQRAGQQGLHLAIFCEGRPTSHHDQRLEALKENIHRFRTVNIHLESVHDIFRITNMFLAQYIPKAVTRLSLCHSFCGGKIYTPHSSEEFLNDVDSPVLPQFKKLIASLSALRISNILLHWNTIKFSRLVELRIHRIRLGHLPAMNSFLKALASASRLRNLGLIEIESYLPEIRPFTSRQKVSLPKLQHLYMEDLHINFIVLLLSSVAPGSYRSTLNISKRTFQSFEESETGSEDEELDDACDALAPFAIHKLILGGKGSYWETNSGLEDLLGSMPHLKTLVLNFFHLDQGLFQALQPPQIPRAKFPKLHTIEFRSARLLDDGEGLKAVITQHPIQNLVLGGYARRESEDNHQNTPLRGDEEIVRWLRSNAPGFRFIEGENAAPEATDGYWQLWDF